MYHLMRQVTPLFYASFQTLSDLNFCFSFEASGGQSSGGSFTTYFLRIFRLIRILRIFKVLRRFRRAVEMYDLVMATMVKSMPALFVLGMFLILKMIFFGSIMYFLESGVFEVCINISYNHLRFTAAVICCFVDSDFATAILCSYFESELTPSFYLSLSRLLKTILVASI